jgi:hypothetical protein
VLREGNADDIRRFIDVDELIALWDDLVLPPYVRRAWAACFRRHGRSDPRRHPKQREGRPASALG